MTDNRLTLEELKWTPLKQQHIELVERKGTGYPDSICDAVAEAVSLALYFRLRYSELHLSFQVDAGEDAA